MPGCGDTAPISCPLHWMEVSGKLQAPRALFPWKEPLALNGQATGWSPDLV
jgi:hypothetical protein